ncbi:MAG: D-tyrosyl-tRNA(Tyr) deacylase [Clostridiales bacterium]|nr:D-tyrosyl-tRNA(Tyr) deacylase [Clostridiales bacterium]
MKAVIQRVCRASVTVDGQITGRCDKGLLVLLGIARGDTEQDARMMCEKILKLRIFQDEKGKMNKSVADVGGKVLTVPNFTLLADCSGGNRPDFFGAEAPLRARELFESFLDYMKEQTGSAEAGVFGAEMAVELLNDGPVTIVLDSKIFKKR